MIGEITSGAFFEGGLAVSSVAKVSVELKNEIEAEKE